MTTPNLALLDWAAMAKLAHRGQYLLCSVERMDDPEGQWLRALKTEAVAHEAKVEVVNGDVYIVFMREELYKVGDYYGFKPGSRVRVVARGVPMDWPYRGMEGTVCDPPMSYPHFYVRVNVPDADHNPVLLHPESVVSLEEIDTTPVDKRS